MHYRKYARLRFSHSPGISGRIDINDPCLVLLCSSIALIWASNLVCCLNPCVNADRPKSFAAFRHRQPTHLRLWALFDLILLILVLIYPPPPPIDSPRTTSMTSASLLKLSGFSLLSSSPGGFIRSSKLGSGPGFDTKFEFSSNFAGVLSRHGQVKVLSHNEQF
ncbi:hypothetical protein BJY52DRAFT_1244519 [Lactarius psammicola]|nr:hypothetical protein BJY52DRAFT_1244519 [Lactarius psammicola]